MILDCHIKMAFSVDDEEGVWELFQHTEIVPGWSLSETDCSGARCVAVFECTEWHEGMRMERIILTIEQILEDKNLSHTDAITQLNRARLMSQL